MQKITHLGEWHALKTHQEAIANQSILTLFAEDKSRFQQFSLEVGDIFFDYSKNRITPLTMQLLFTLARAVNLPEKITRLFNGQMVNVTEQRPALHTALRQPSPKPFYVDGVDIAISIQSTLQKMQCFTEKVRNKIWRGATGKPIHHIVNVGIGGSHLGPQAATLALSQFASPDLQCHFLSNIDSSHLTALFNKIDAETTLFIISSKSFSTLETLTNAETIKKWLLKSLPGKNVSAHFVAVTAATEKAKAMGIPEDQIFPLWDWVGGRYSVWSAIGLPLALMIGMDRFFEFLNGAHAIDQHFQQADFSENLPVIMALLGIWYINFFGATTHAIIPYSQQLNYFRAHLQQLEMESNGKRIAENGEVLDYLTGPIIWGEHGCNGQHAFHQLLHQGQHFVPVDFILVGENDPEWSHHQDMLIASALSQAEALLHGKTYEQARQELLLKGVPKDKASYLAKHKSIPGNRPSNVLFLKKMTPFNLGALFALYEHKIFVQGALWNINSFDQWGVELGKQLLPPILDELKNSITKETQHDASTLGLIEYYKKLK